jgi:hypothetical protein
MAKPDKKEILANCKFAHTEEELNSLAKEIRELFPKGINLHTNTANRQPVRELADALIRFEDYYQLEATREEILAAAKKYTKDKEYDPYRQCSKYFIIKNLTKEGRGITSALATYIETARDSNTNDTIESNWIDALS